MDQKIPEYKLIRSLRRTLSLQINRDGEIIVKAPLFIPSLLINRFVADRHDWIMRNLQKFKNTPIKRVRKYTNGEKFMFMGKIYPLNIGNFNEINISDKLNFPAFMEFRIQKEIKDWYIKQARTIITQRAEFWTQTMKTGFLHIRFSDTASKWGSCSAENNLQFNWRLIMAPLLVIDYVIVHELAHTREKNHSRKFWNLVGFFKPAYKQYRKWLNDNSHNLHI